MFRRSFSTRYMRELSSIERIFKEGYSLVGCDYYLIWFKKVNVDGIITQTAIRNEYIEENLSRYTLVLELAEHFRKLETHNP